MWRTVTQAVGTLIRQNRIIFRPRPPLPRTPADLELAYEAVELRYGGIKGTRAWWVPQGPPGANSAAAEAPTIIFFHGSDGHITRELPVLRFLHRLGAHVLMLEYPGYGSRWGFPNEFDCYWAAAAAWRFVCDTKGVDAARIVLFGHSVGSGVAVQLATQVSCGGLVLQSPFTSVPDLAEHLYPGWPARFFCFTHMNSLRRIDRCRCPLLVFHSPADQHIPYAQGQRLFTAAHPPKRFVNLTGSHWSRSWLQDDAVRSAWRELLSGQWRAWPSPREAPHA